MNIYPKLMCQLLLCWIVPVTFIVHDLWTIAHDHPAHHKGEQGEKGEIGEPSFATRNVPIFPTEFDNEFVHFFKNVGMIGGLVFYLEVGA